MKRFAKEVPAIKNIICLFLTGLIIFAAGCGAEPCRCDPDAEQLMKNERVIYSRILSPDSGFGDYWKRFHEPLLNERKVESYRFSVVVLLADFFKVYRIDRSSRNYQLQIKTYAVSTTVSYRADSLVSWVSTRLSKDQWESISGAIEQSCFWTMTTDIAADDGYLDGSGWMIEGYRHDKNCTDKNYHVVHRNSPQVTEGTADFLKICDQFIALDSLNVRSFLNE